ncbi:hypothetical protein ACLOJK_041429 [Asimina triloba]
MVHHRGAPMVLHLLRKEPAAMVGEHEPLPSADEHAATAHHATRQPPLESLRRHYHHAPPDRHCTCRLLDASNARHQCPMLMLAARWRVGMGVARPHRPTVTTDVKGVSYAAAAASVPTPPPATVHRSLPIKGGNWRE